MTPEHAIKCAIAAANSSQRSEAESIDWTPGYSEPGYEAGRTLDHRGQETTHGVFFANWNPDSFDKDTPKCARVMSRLCDILERMGCDIEWSDEWDTCTDCGNAFRNSPDSYSWTYYGDCWSAGDPWCGNCIIDNPGEYIESLRNNPHRANTIDGLDLSLHGWKLLQSGYESGFHPGQNDDPKEIVKRLGLDEFVFEISGTGQFDITFSVYVPDEQGVE